MGTFLAGAIAALSMTVSAAFADTTIKMVEVISSPPRTELLKKQIAGFEQANPGDTLSSMIICGNMKFGHPFADTCLARMWGSLRTPVVHVSSHP